MNALFPQAPMSLVFQNGPLAGRYFPIDKAEIHIGSSPDNDIVIRDQYIFPHHVVMRWNNGTLFLGKLDAQSTVAVNRHLIQDQWVPLDFNYMISLGQSEIAFHLVASNPVSPASPTSLSTSPHATVQSVRPVLSYDVSDTTTPRPIAAPAYTPPQQVALPIANDFQALNETTRYLSMAARIDQEFRNYVFKHIVREKHRAIGESHGVDILAVVKSCYAAQRQIFVRDVILSVLLAIPLLLFIRGILGYIGVSANANSNPISSFLSAFLLIAVVFSTLALIILFVFFVQLVQIKKIPVAIRVVLSLIALSILSAISFSLLFYLAAWGVIVWNLWNMYYGTETQQLTKNKFNPGNIQLPPGQQLDPELANLSNQDENIIVYSGFSPFVGSGFNVDGWSFAVDATKGKQKMGALQVPETPEPFQIKELYTCVDQAMQALRLPKLTISDKLYVNGKAIPDSPNGTKDANFFDNARKRPLTRVDDALVQQWMETFSEDVRYYKCFRAITWKGELIVSIFVRFIRIEKNLFIETSYMVLPPLKEEYYLLDMLEPTFTLKKLWNLTKLSFFSTFSLWFLSPLHVITYLTRDWSARREQEQVERLIANHPTFDYGASTSLREVASSSDYLLHFQRLDKEMYIKIIERQLLESIINFLDSKNIDTSDLKERQETILNHGVIVTGGNVESLAFGEKARATSNRFGEAANNARGTGTKPAS